MRTGEIITNAKNLTSLERVEKIILITERDRIEAMRLFVISRQNWCKKEILKSLKDLK